MYVLRSKSTGEAGCAGAGARGDEHDCRDWEGNCRLCSLLLLERPKAKGRLPAGPSNLSPYGLKWGAPQTPY